MIGKKMQRITLGILIMLLFLGGCSYKEKESEQEEAVTEEMQSAEQEDTAFDAIIYDDLPEDSGKTEYFSLVNDTSGYLLYCSSPALGYMSKYIFYTEDGGATYLEGVDVTSMIHNYPQAMIFFTEEIGFVVTDYHGTDEYLYKTTDGGKTWFSEKLDIPDEVRYINGVDIKKADNSTTDGELYLQGCMDDDSYVSYHFTTADAGETWTYVE